MPTQSSNGAGAKRAGTEAKKSGARAAKAGKRAARKTAAAERNQVLAAAETAVDLPVGAVLGARDRVTNLLEPWTGPAAAREQLKSYRERVGKSLRRTERRGAGVRRRVERTASKRRRDVAGTLKRNRDEVERLVRRTLEEQAGRAQGLVGQVTDQLGALR